MSRTIILNVSKYERFKLRPYPHGWILTKQRAMKNKEGKRVVRSSHTYHQSFEKALRWAVNEGLKRSKNKRFFDHVEALIEAIRECEKTFSSSH